MTPELAKLPKIGHAQGLCYAFDSLYVVVSSRSSTLGCGVYRLLDTDGDDNFDKLVKLKYLGDTAGEHGPHAIIPAPDGKHLYVIIGNQTKVPTDSTHSRVPEVWGEDQLLPSLQHFMKGAEAPLVISLKLILKKTWRSSPPVSAISMTLPSIARVSFLPMMQTWSGILVLPGTVQPGLTM